MTLAETIDEILIAMTAAGMRQCDLAKALDVSDARISMMLRPRCNLRTDTIERIHRAIAEFEKVAPKERDWRAAAAAQAVKINAMRAKIRRLTIKLEKLEDTLSTGGNHEETDRRCRHGNGRHRCTSTCRGSAMPNP
jgi:transcriptional regulator with XRE-family HTH domain